MSRCGFVLWASAWFFAGAFVFSPAAALSGRARASGPGVILNEVMARPVPGATEWIELWNLSGEDVSLREWSLEDSRRKPSRVASADLLVGPHAYLILAADEDAFLRQFPRVDPGVVHEIEGSWPSLNNSQPAGQSYADMVILSDAGGRVVDSLAYGGDWGVAGCSLERLDPAAGPVAFNWCASVAPGGATPGAPNSVYLEHEPASPIVAEPDPFRPELDGVTIIAFEISTPSPVIRFQVFDVSGRLVRTLLDDRAAGRSGRLAWDGMDERGDPVPTGIYVLYLQAVDTGAGSVVEAKGTVRVARGF